MYVTVADLQKYTKLKTDDVTALQIYLDSALGIINNYLGYNPEIDYHTEYIDSWGDNKIKLRHKPVNLVYKITDYTNNEILFEARQDLDQDYIIEEEYVTFKSIIFPKDKLKVEYVSGYGLLDFSANTLNGGNAETTYLDYERTIDGGNAEGYDLIFNYIDGGTALTIGVIETSMPVIFKQTVLRIAALLLTEADNNIGITSKSFGDMGSRTFISYTNFDKYLYPLSKYRLIII
jgi:hypothetical protein